MTEHSLDEVMSTGYYDHEAGRYDESRGGAHRARAAAEAIATLVTPPGRCLDVAGGTGAVAAELAARGWQVAVTDLSAGMLAVAADRFPGRVVRADATRLPVGDADVDLVTVVWMLNLVPKTVADRVIAEAARVLRPGGHLVATVDKERTHNPSATDLTDGLERVTAVAAAVGLVEAGTRTFEARTQWVTPEGGQIFRLAAFSRQD